MKLVIAMMKHETNTFSPVPTPLSRFGPHGPYFGRAAYDAFKGTGTPMGAFIDLAESERAEVVTPVAAEAYPSGPVQAEAYRAISDAICDAVASGCDAVLLDLHGAMVAESTDDGEGTLLERIRSLAPGVPIAVALDLHTNLTDRMVRHCTAMVGYKTYPHVDMYEAGRHVGTIVLRALRNELRPVMAWSNRPILAQTLRMGTSDSPMKELIAAARQAEQRECLAATVFGGFPLADVPEAGVSCVVVTDRDPDAARAICDRLLDAAWERREEFQYRSEPLAQSIARAKAFEDGPVLLIDHADNCASGGTQDTMAVVAETLRQGLKDVAVGAICDPPAVEQMIAAGVGSKLTLPLGGKVDMPAISRKGSPLTVSGVVRVISDGEFTIRGPMYTGVRAFLGKTAVLDTGDIQFVVISRQHEPWDLGIFRSVGIEPTAKKYLLLKSRIHYRAGFLPIARHIVECAGEGVTSSDLSLFKFRKLRRPMFPLDPILPPTPPREYPDPLAAAPPK
jgi:microcystin degradation protein MlrC